jgi:DNA-binding MarR family transcriptional regulator
MHIKRLTCACATVRRASRAVTSLYETELRKAGIKPTQFTILRFLDNAPGASQTRMGAELALDHTTLVRTVDLLAAKGWVRRGESPDRRERRLELTGAGRRKLREGHLHWENAQRKLRGALGAEKWEAIWAVLDAAAAAALEVQPGETGRR